MIEWKKEMTGSEKSEKSEKSELMEKRFSYLNYLQRQISQNKFFLL